MDHNATSSARFGEACSRCGKTFGLFTADGAKVCTCHTEENEQPPETTTANKDSASLQTSCPMCGRTYALFSVETSDVCICTSEIKDRSQLQTRSAAQHALQKPCAASPENSIESKHDRFQADFEKKQRLIDQPHINTDITLYHGTEYGTEHHNTSNYKKIKTQSHLKDDDSEELNFTSKDISDSTDLECEKPEDIWAIEIPWYKLTSHISSDSFCHVFKAHRDGFGQDFVVKVLKKKYAHDPMIAKRFVAQVKKASTINQVNLAPVYDAGFTEKGDPYFVTDFIDGVPLSTIINDRGFLPDDEAIDIFIQICDALNEAHSADVLHLNLNPRNIFVSVGEQGNAVIKVTDVGIFKALPNPAQGTGDKTQHLIGDALYMSPEQCSGGKLDVQSDVYSLGCLMYHTLGGHPPLRGLSPNFTAMKHIERHPLSLSERFPELGVSLALENVVMRALQKDRLLRYPSIAELQIELIAIKEAAQAASSSRHIPELMHAVALPNAKSYRRIFLLSVFFLTLAFTYNNQLFHNTAGNTSNKSDTQIATDSRTKFDSEDAEKIRPEQAGRHRVMIYGTDGKLLNSTDAINFGQALETAVYSGIDLNGADLKGQDLAGLRLTGAKLQNADFSNANLTGTNLTRADLRNAQFSGSTMTNATFDHANMRDSIITDSELSNSRFFDTNLTNSSWRDCNLDDANLSAADFQGAALYQIELPRASMIGTRGFIEKDRFPGKAQENIVFSRSGKILFKSPTMQTFRETIEEAIKSGVSLKGANLRAVDLYEADLRNADLRDADLRGALLSKAKLDNADFTGALTKGLFTDASASEVEAARVKGWQLLFSEYLTTANGSDTASTADSSQTRGLNH